ncbi:hypothetical protein KL936_004789 [Ogataea polymorpha]|nr:hypothetical protein KL936_004789 [Ogataea polymorpha]
MSAKCEPTGLSTLKDFFALDADLGRLPIDDDARSKHYLPQFWLLLPRPPVGVITGCLSTAKPDHQASWHSHGAAGGGACLRDHLEDGLQLAIQRSTALL